MSAIISGLIGSVIALGLTTLAERTQKSATNSHGGWRVIKAGWYIRGAIIASVAAVAITGYFLASGGSARPDAASQNGAAALLLAFFGAGALYMWWSAYGRTIMWKGNELRVRTMAGKEVTRRLSEVTQVKTIGMLGEYRIRFRDGSTLRFDAHMHGAEELLTKIPRRAFRV